jgi:hypothetical protein
VTAPADAPIHVKRALTLIGPASEQEAACAAAIAAHIRLLHLLWEKTSAIPTPGVLRKELKEIVRDLNRTKRVFTKYSKAANAIIFWNDSAKQQTFFDDIGRCIEAAQFHHDNLVFRPGGHRWDNVKAIAAKYAKELLSFSPKPPTQSHGGAFYKLAALLYKAATGEDADLEHYCRELGRIEPNVVVKISFSAQPLTKSDDAAER